MLLSLHIQNYAIIENLEIDFSKGLNIITGETGAGKSIVMGALGLILGERADTSILLKQDKKCFIEGVFRVEGKKNVVSFLKENDLFSEDDLVLRREINANGKSRGFINDTPATLQQLKQLASLLVDLHRQFDALELGEATFQREVVDALANNEVISVAYRTVFFQWSQAKQQLKQLLEKKINFNKELGYHQFLFDELHEAAFKENELEEAEASLKILAHAEEIKSVLTKANYDLVESEQPLVQLLKQIIQQFRNYQSFHSVLAEITDRLQSAQIELLDVSGEIESLNNSINYDAEKIELINERLALGYKLSKKHGVQTTGELLIIQQGLEEKLQAVLNMEEAIEAKENETHQLFTKANELANTISDNRHRCIDPLEKKVNSLLCQIGMPNALIKVKLSATDLTETGIDNIEFLFDGNKSNRFEPLRKVASGGELSRLMLCIKSLVAEKIDLPTLIFDEIDTGISGEAAKQVGLIMKKLSEKRQVICITHQPQIAGKADTHFFVYKEIVKDAVKTNMRVLNNDERIQAIAQMLSGEKPTAAALENAKEMVGN